MKISEVIDYLSRGSETFEFTGNAETEILCFCNLQNIKDQSICWVRKKKYLSEEVYKKLIKANDVTVVAPFAIEGVNTIATDNPKAVFFSILNRFFSKKKAHSISDRAAIFTDKIGDNVGIGMNCYIGEDVSIGDNTVIYPNVVIDCPCVIGQNCVIHSGAVIGSDVEGFYFDGDIPVKEEHFAGVIIGNNVEIGANTTIARGLLTDTTICDNVKIWDLCHIGHNAYIGENSLIIVGSYICGSAVLGKNTYLAPASGVLNQVTLGDRVTVGVNSVAMGNVRDGATIMGTPGMEFLPKKLRKEG